MRADPMAEFRTQRGRIRTALAVGISLLALAALALAGMPASVRVGMGIGVVAMVFVALRRAPRHRLRLANAGPAMLDGHAGTLSASAISPLYVALELRSPTGVRRRAGVFRDELPAGEFRALLARLRSG